ncbi:hypothetical protein LY474_35025 [Myxococcus stipitatus]|uniref:hypothetical protein n=1 Tax=Myxococcus stipitatus TaxID=83455 RepID=UPI001F18F7DE|nr:hypothetical protein [Myxococcus stipitatus]MCE9673032.1 hypothetical protein [Myxococcus stipitatus]
MALVGCSEPSQGVREFAGSPSQGGPRSEAPGDGTWMGESLGEGCSDGGTPGDAGTPSDVVLVTNTTRFYTAVGTAERVEDQSANPPEIYVPQGSTFSLLLGSAAPGGWRFTGVPSGPYYLRVGTTYYVTDERHVEVGTNRLGRPDTVFTEHFSTPLQLNLVNMAPWTNWSSATLPGSSLQLASAQVDLYGAVNLFDYIPDGETRLLTTAADFFATTDRMPVFEANKGDRLYISQNSQYTAGTAPDGTQLGYTTVDRSVEVGAFDFVTDGVTPLPLSGVMQPVRRTEFPLEWRLPAYTRLMTDAHPLATPSLPVFYVFPAAHGTSDGWIGYSGELLTMLMPRGASFDYTHRLQFGNPFPSSWGVVGQGSYSMRALETVPDGSGRRVYVQGSIAKIDEFNNLIASPVEPTVSPPRALAIDGVPASTQRQVGSANPVISWLPPAMGTVNAYRVAFYRLDPGATTPVFASAIYLSGSATQVRLPPGMLSPASIYYVRVSAYDAPHYDVERDPVHTRERLPTNSADAFSSLFTTP